MIRRDLFFLLSRAIGSRVRAEYAATLKLERAGPACLAALSEERLAAVLRHAARDIPYYRARLPAGGTPVLTDFPVLTKHDVAARFTELMAAPLRAETEAGRERGAGYSWIKVRTGGTTGTPTTVVHDASFRDRGRAGRLYSQYLCGFPFGVPYFRLWGSMAEINRLRQSPGQRLMGALAGERLLNAFLMSQADMDRYLDALARSPIRHMMAYVDAAHALALHARRAGRAARPLESIMACAGTVTDDARAALRDVFGARVHNKYGSRDCTDMACECERGGMHVYSHHAWIEVLDDGGRAVAPGRTGRLVVTLLGNFSFPMIRYEIGDIGALSARQCDCGRPFPLMERIEGRAAEFLTSVSGGYVSPVYIRHLVGVVHNPGTIRCFQLVQTGASAYRLALELDASVADAAYLATAAGIRHDLLRVLGADADLEIVRAERIAPSAGGKFLYAINRHRETA